MIDDFLRDLFSSDAPADFGSRFNAGNDAPPGGFNFGGGGGMGFMDMLPPGLRGGFANMLPGAGREGGAEGGNSIDTPTGRLFEGSDGYNAEMERRNGTPFGERFMGAPQPNGPVPVPQDGVISPDNLQNRLDGTIDLSARRGPLGGPGAGGVPLPQPRPDVEAILSGNRPANGPAANGAPPDLFAKLAGLFRGGGMDANAQAPAGTAPAGAPGSGLTPGQKLFRNAVTSFGGGVASGNPAFKGGAFGAGFGGATKAGSAAERLDTKEERDAANDLFRQSQYDRSQTDKEKTSDALRKLYGARAAHVTSGGAAGARESTAWNKPPHERWKDANKLINDTEKIMRGKINPLAPKAEREAQQKKVDEDMARFRDQTYKQYGLDKDGNALPGSTGGATGGKPKVPSTGKTVSDKEAIDRGLYHAGTQDDPHEPTSQEEFDSVKPGEYFVNPKDGQVMRKKGQKRSEGGDADEDDTGTQTASNSDQDEDDVG